MSKTKAQLELENSAMRHKLYALTPLIKNAMMVANTGWSIHQAELKRVVDDLVEKGVISRDMI